MSGTKGHSGRHPMPTNLKLLTGNAGKRPLNEAEPKPEPAALAAPEHLDPTARAFWEKYAPLIIGFGLLTELDVPEFAAACQQESLYQRLMSTIIRAPTGKRAQALSRRADAALANRDRILARFGFDPASRAKLSVKAPEPEDAFEALMRRKVQR